jgi:AcrR family transcriptional regulator
MATAIDCFARYGYQGTSIERIATAAGVTKGALYYHFRDKEELLFEAVQDRIGEFERKVVGSVSPETDPAGALAEIARVCVQIATRNNLRRFILTLMVEALDTNPQLSERFRGILRRFRSYLAGIVRVRTRAGRVRRDLDPRSPPNLRGWRDRLGCSTQAPSSVDFGVAMEGVVAQLMALLASSRARLAARQTPSRPVAEEGTLTQLQLDGQRLIRDTGRLRPRFGHTPAKPTAQGDSLRPGAKGLGARPRASAIPEDTAGSATRTRPSRERSSPGWRTAISDPAHLQARR